LISIFGDTEGIAQIGALGRLMVILMLVQNGLDLLIVPRFARLLDNGTGLLTRFFIVVGVVITVSLVIISGVYFFPKPLLFILGKDYKYLEYEIFLMAIGSCISMVNTVINKLALARGIIPRPVIILPITIIVQISILFFIVDYTTVQGVLIYSILSSSFVFIYFIAHFVSAVINFKNVQSG
jgi:hypothetical protein